MRRNGGFQDDDTGKGVVCGRLLPMAGRVNLGDGHRGELGRAVRRVGTAVTAVLCGEPDRRVTTPAKAILAECRSCKGGQIFRCESLSCALNKSDGTSLRKIKAHCIECNGDDHPRECTGRLLNGDTCNLHPFRLGTNPQAKKRTLSPEHKAKLAEAGRKHRFGTGQNSQSTPPGSTTSPPGILEGRR